MKQKRSIPPATPNRRGAWVCALAFAWSCASDDADTAGDAGTTASGSASTGDTPADASSPGGPDGTSDGGSPSGTAGDSTAMPNTGDDTTGAPSTSTSPASTDEGPPQTDSANDGPPQCVPEPAPDICQAAHDHWVVCVYGEPGTDQSYLNDCSCRLQFAASEFGPACVAVLEDWYACVAQAECMDILLDEHCGAQYGAVDAECPELSPPA